MFKEHFRHSGKQPQYSVKDITVNCQECDFLLTMTPCSLSVLYLESVLARQRVTGLPLVTGAFREEGKAIHALHALAGILEG